MLDLLPGRWLRASTLLALGLTACDGGTTDTDAGSTPADAGALADAGSTDAAAADASTPSDARPWLYVVNTNDDLTSYAAASTADGPVEPRTTLEQGGTTMLFQPRAIAVTPSGRMLVGRQNGGIVGWDALASADGATPADRTIEDTGLSTVIEFAYDAAADRLFVGVPNAANGVLVYDDVSSDAFDGSVAPSRSFGPSDRAPHDPTGSIQMTVDALAFDAAGLLYVVDTSGLNTNHSRVLVYEGAGAADGETAPARIFESDAWAGVVDIAITGAGDLIAVDDTATIFTVRGAATAEGMVTPETVTASPARAALAGVLVGSDGTVYVTDRENADIYVFDGLDGSDGTPDRTIAGTPTGLRGPRAMFLVE
ncbi:MAG: hypothetical protein H6719_25445 [Sandaracinaceae bacterium]|nr:hypothetical protein [Sandaracinaceae bacterium]